MSKLVIVRGGTEELRDGWVRDHMGNWIKVGSVREMVYGDWPKFDLLFTVPQMELWRITPMMLLGEALGYEVLVVSFIQEPRHRLELVPQELPFKEIINTIEKEGLTPYAVHPRSRKVY